MRFATLQIVTVFIAAVGAVNPLGETHLSTQRTPCLIQTVDLTYSKYQGQTLQNGVNQWLSIRYAAPPTGTRRFSAPQPPLAENATQDATIVRPPPYQQVELRSPL